MNGSHHVPTTKLTLLAVSKDEWDTKEGNGKSMKNALLYSNMAKGTSRAEVMSKSEKIKPVALVIVNSVFGTIWTKF